MSKLACLGALVAVTRLAGADPAAQRKAEPDKFAKAASQAFSDARAADEAGKLSDALRLYEKANAIAPHPSTVYNIADVQRRMKNLRGAIQSYKKYLGLVPDAPDRADVEQTIAELEKTPATLTVESDEPEAYVFVDGQQLSGKLPASIDVLDGSHAIDLITPISSSHTPCNVTAGHNRTCRVRVSPRMDGNVIISSPASRGNRGWRERGIDFHTNRRFQLDPGRYTIHPLDSSHECSATTIDVAEGDGVTYVYVDAPKERRGTECLQVKATQRVLHFKP